VGSQDDFGYAQRFLNDTNIGNGEVTMLWERSGKVWNINQVRSNSALQLFSYDLSSQSQTIAFNDPGREVVLETIVQEPWAPPGAPFLGG